jgi:hypothetical protein
MHPIPSWFTVLFLALTTVAAAPCAATGGVQQASASSHGSGVGLALHSGATLAPPKILDFGSDPVGITRMVEDQDGADRRTDTTADVTYELQAEALTECPG